MRGWWHNPLFEAPTPMTGNQFYPKQKEEQNDKILVEPIKSRNEQNMMTQDFQKHEGRKGSIFLCDLCHHLFYRKQDPPIDLHILSQNDCLLPCPDHSFRHWIQ